MRRYALQFGVSLLLVLFSASQALSCSCASPGVREKFRAADAVFVGNLIEMTPTTPSEDFPLAVSVVRFRVERGWKASSSPEIVAIANFDNPGWCGDLNLTVGEHYLIYAYRHKGHLIVETDCGPNRNLKYAATEIKRLDSFWFRQFARLYPYPRW